MSNSIDPLRVCVRFRNTAKCTYGEDCKFEHSTGDPIVVPRGVCFKWSQDDECPYENCRFFHGTEEESQAAADDLRAKIMSGEVPADSLKRRKAKKKAKRQNNTNTDGEVEGEGEQKKSTRKKKKKAVQQCHSFADGDCSYGDECRFKHGEDDNRDFPAMARNRRGPCHRWRDTGECEYGTECRYSH
jgi:hypothetical protein